MKAASKEKRVPTFLGPSIPLTATKTSATAEAWGKERHSYKPLPTQFRRDGFEYWQVVREKNAAIYEQTWSGCRNSSICYEVIRIRRRECFQIGGRLIQAAEIYPRSEDWGIHGWTVQDKERAFRKLRQIASPEVGVERC